MYTPRKENLISIPLIKLWVAAPNAHFFSLLQYIALLALERTRDFRAPAKDVESVVAITDLLHRTLEAFGLLYR
jgi:hypothetical protein